MNKGREDVPFGDAPREESRVWQRQEHGRQRAAFPPGRRCWASSVRARPEEPGSPHSLPPFHRAPPTHPVTSRAKSRSQNAAGRGQVWETRGPEFKSYLHDLIKSLESTSLIEQPESFRETTALFMTVLEQSWEFLVGPVMQGWCLFCFTLTLGCPSREPQRPWGLLWAALWARCFSCLIFDASHVSGPHAKHICAL